MQQQKIKLNVEVRSKQSSHICVNKQTNACYSIPQTQTMLYPLQNLQKVGIIKLQ